MEQTDRRIVSLTKKTCRPVRTSENTNGLIRRYLPKRQSMAHLSQRACSRLATHLNNRPRIGAHPEFGSDLLDEQEGRRPLPRSSEP